MKYTIITIFTILALPLYGQFDIKTDTRVGVEMNSINVFYINESFFNDLDQILNTNIIRDTIRIEKQTATVYASGGIDLYAVRVNAMLGLGGKFGNKTFIPRIRGRIEGSLYPLVLFNGMNGYGVEKNRAFSLGYAIEVDGSPKKKVANKIQGYLFFQGNLDFTDGELYVRFNADLSKSEMEKVKVPYFSAGLNYDLGKIITAVKKYL